MDADERIVHCRVERDRLECRRYAKLVLGILRDKTFPIDDRKTGHGWYLLVLRGDHGDRDRPHLLCIARNKREINQRNSRRVEWRLIGKIASDSK